MFLYQGAVEQFIQDAQLNKLADKIDQAYFTNFGHHANSGEINSWRNSLQHMSNVFGLAGLGPQGVIIELQLPLTSKRLDVMVAGQKQHYVEGRTRDQAVIVELKQWSHVDESALTDHVAVAFAGGSPRDTLHPSAQVNRYEQFLRDMSEVFSSGEVSLSSLAFLHNLDRDSSGAAPLFDKRFHELLDVSPIYAKDQFLDLARHLEAQVGAGQDSALAKRIVSSDYRPSKKLLDHVASVIASEKAFVLIDEQVTAFTAVHDELQRASRKSKPTTFIINGGPGTGKSLIALQLLASAAAEGRTVAHATGSKAFTEGLKQKVGIRAGTLMKYFNSFMKKSEPLDLLVADEAHRIRETSASRWTKKEDRGGSQIEELLDAARVAAFFIDDRQVVRPGEVGSAALIRAASESRGQRVYEYDLSAQFRCGGSEAYVRWVDRLLGVSLEGEDLLDVAESGFEFQIVDTPEALEQHVHGKLRQGESSRLVAGFCWKWSDPRGDGTLVNDVVVGDWERPWNAKSTAGRLAPGIPSSNAWAVDPAGVHQVGCVYTAQGFEFDRVGMIWGNDLVWRTNGWVAQAKFSHDSIVKRADSKDPDFFRRLVAQTYRVLLTRGMKGCAVTFTDQETEDYVRSKIIAKDFV